MAGTKKTKAQLVSADITLIPSGVPDGVIASNHRQSNEDAYTSSVNKLDDKVESQTDLSTRTRLGATEDFNHAEGDGKTFVTFEEAQALAGGGTVTSVNGVSPVAGNVAIDTSSDLSTTYYTDKVGVNNSNGDGTEILAVGVMNAGVMLPVDKAKIDKYPDTATNGKILQGNGSTYVEVDPTSEATNLSITNRTATTLDVASDTGTDATVPSANATQAGLMTATDFNKSDLIEKFNTDLLRYKIAPVIPADSTGDNAIITRIYANTNYLRTTGSLPIQIVYVSPTGNDLTGQKGNFYAPYTPAGGVAAAVAGDTIMWIGGTYSVGSNMFKSGVSHATFGPVNLTFTTGGSFGASLNVSGDFNIISAEQVFGGNNIGANVLIRINTFNQTAGIFCNITGGGYKGVDVIFESGTLSGSAGGIVTPPTGTSKITGRINSTSTGISVSSNNYANIFMILVNTTNAGQSFVAANNHQGSCVLSIYQNSTSSATFGRGSYNGVINGGILKTNRSNIYCDLDTVTIQLTNGISYSNVYGELKSVSITFNSNNTLLRIYSKLITTLTCTNGGNSVLFDGCVGTDINLTAGTNKYFIKNNSELTLTTGSYLPSSGVNNLQTEIEDSKITYNHDFLKELGRQTPVTCKMYNSTIINNSASPTSVVFYKTQPGNVGLEKWLMRGNTIITNGTELAGSMDTNYFSLVLEGSNNFTPKLTQNKAVVIGNEYNDVRVRLTASASDIDFTNDENGMTIVNSTAFGRNITNTNFKRGSNFTFINTNATTVTITVNAPLNFLNGTTATTKTIAQNECFTFTNIDGNNIIIK